GQNGGDNRQKNFFVGERERAQGDQGVMEDRDHGGNAVNPLEAESEIDQHSQEGVQDRQLGLGLKLMSNLRPDDADVANAEVGKEKALLQSRAHRRIDDCVEIVERAQHAAAHLVAMMDNGLRDGGVALVGVSAGVQRILFHEVVLDCQRAGVVEVLLSLWRV